MLPFAVNILQNWKQVQGFVHSKTGEKLATLFGKWDEAMYYVMGDLSERHKSYDPMSDAVQLWERADPPQKMTRYGLTAFATTLNELTPGLEVHLSCSSKSRDSECHLVPIIFANVSFSQNHHQ
jgi:hypothetical protein